MAITSASLPAKKRILTVCVRLFLEKGYKRSTLAEIIEKADVSYSTFQNIFRAKDGVLTELVEFMFSNQFAMARGQAGAKLPPVYVYAVETAIQMTLTELNENLREIYIEAYTQKEASEYILRETAKELHGIFGRYLPDADSAGLLRHGDRLGQHHARLHGAPLRRGADAGKEAAAVSHHEPAGVQRPQGGSGAGHPLRRGAGHPGNCRTGDAEAVQGAGHALRIFPHRADRAWEGISQ